MCRTRDCIIECVDCKLGHLRRLASRQIQLRLRESREGSAAPRRRRLFARLAGAPLRRRASHWRGVGVGPFRSAPLRRPTWALAAHDATRSGCRLSVPRGARLRDRRPELCLISRECGVPKSRDGAHDSPPPRAPTPRRPRPAAHHRSRRHSMPIPDRSASRQCHNCGPPRALCASRDRRHRPLSSESSASACNFCVSERMQRRSLFQVVSHFESTLFQVEIKLCKTRMSCAL